MEDDWVQFEKEEFRIRGRKVGSSLYSLDTVEQYENITAVLSEL